MVKVIAIANQKNGVAKISTTHKSKVCGAC